MSKMEIKTQKQGMFPYNTTSHKKLDTVPGIGPRIKEKLLDYYKSEQLAFDSLRKGLIGSVPGISHKQAIKLARNLFESEQKVTLKDVLKNEDSIAQYEKILQLIQQYLTTEYSKNKLRMFYPLPSQKLPIIKERLEYFKKALLFARKYSSLLERKGFKELLKKLDAFRSLENLPKIKNRVLVTNLKEIDAIVKEEGWDTLIRYEFLEKKKAAANKDESENYISHKIEEYSKTFDVVIFIGKNASQLPPYSNIITVPYGGLQKQELSRSELFITLIPEATIQLFAKNRTLIQNMLKITVFLKSLKEDELLKDFDHIFVLEKLKEIKNATLILTPQGQIKEGTDHKLDRLRKLTHEFPSLIAETESRINERIKEDIEDRSISIKGDQILNFFRTDLSLEEIRDYIPPEVDDLIQTAIEEEIQTLAKQLELTRTELNMIENLYPQQLEYPIQLNETGIEELENYFKAQAATYEFQMLLNLAKKLQDTQRFLLTLHQTLLEFEFFYGIGKFTQDFNLSIPRFKTHKKGFFGTQMINLSLQNEYLSQNLFKTDKNVSPPVPITYGVGEIITNKEDLRIEMDINEKDLSRYPENINLNAPLVLLTGSNSGGKTMTLLTCMQNIILAQMGFPVSGNVILHPFDEIYFFKKSNGQLSAGAFETTLLQFVELSHSDKLKIVFADELESITEPRAASKVLAGIFNLFIEKSHNYGIFVTHLVELILKEMDKDKEKIRIDGIEALGLDEQLQLIVDRNPRFNFIARSTPELIITRLAKSGSSTQREFFTSLLKKFS